MVSAESEASLRIQQNKFKNNQFERKSNGASPATEELPDLDKDFCNLTLKT